MTHAVVLGGGMAGMLAAAALAEHVDRVTVVESDRFPDGPLPRKGLPQGHHFHMFMGGGVDALDELLPGTSDLLYAAGAHRRRMGDEFLGVSMHGWSRPYDGRAYVLAASRHLLDHVVRGRVLSHPAIDVVEGTKAIGLVGDAARVTGVRLESRADQDADRAERTLAADVVVDATGRGSRAPVWLEALGLPKVAEDLQDAGFAYAGRTYEAPAALADGFPAILVQADSGTGRPGRGAGLLPNEDGKWIVSMIGTKGAQPPTDEEGYLAFARSLQDPLVAELMAAARPLTEIRAYRGLVNRQRHFEKLPVPDGFLVVGDAATILNPNYATGMSMAAFQALALRAELLKRGLANGFTRRVQTAVAKSVVGSWQAATFNDSLFPGAESTMKVRGGKGQQRFIARWNRVSAENPAVARATFEVASFLAPRRSMMTLPLLFTVLRGPRHPEMALADAIERFPAFREPLSRIGSVIPPG
ncbi:FAD-binding protein [Actinosynnema sp. NPDC023794]